MKFPFTLTSLSELEKEGDFFILIQHLQKPTAGTIPSDED
jgi:hypothetical protein